MTEDREVMGRILASQYSTFLGAFVHGYNLAAWDQFSRSDSGGLGELLSKPTPTRSSRAASQTAKARDTQ